ncbi:MAG: hypothetical protein ACXW3Q_14925, partial [Rhodoplanes sp.]
MTGKAVVAREKLSRHCEERSDEAIQYVGVRAFGTAGVWIAAPAYARARNDGYGRIPRPRDDDEKR